MIIITLNCEKLMAKRLQIHYKMLQIEFIGYL